MGKVNEICAGCEEACKQFEWIELVNCPKYSPRERFKNVTRRLEREKAGRTRKK